MESLHWQQSYRDIGILVQGWRLVGRAREPGYCQRENLVSGCSGASESERINHPPPPRPGNNPSTGAQNTTPNNWTEHSSPASEEAHMQRGTPPIGQLFTSPWQQNERHDNRGSSLRSNFSGRGYHGNNGGSPEIQLHSRPLLRGSIIRGTYRSTEQQQQQPQRYRQQRQRRRQQQQPQPQSRSPITTTTTTTTTVPGSTSSAALNHNGHRLGVPIIVAVHSNVLRSFNAGLMRTIQTFLRAHLPSMLRSQHTPEQQQQQQHQQQQQQQQQQGPSPAEYFAYLHAQFYFETYLWMYVNVLRHPQSAATRRNLYQAAQHHGIPAAVLLLELLSEFIDWYLQYRQPNYNNITSLLAHIHSTGTVSARSCSRLRDLSLDLGIHLNPRQMLRMFSSAVRVLVTRNSQPSPPQPPPRMQV